MLESGWEELGMDDQWAARVATDMVDEDNPATPIDFYKVILLAVLTRMFWGLTGSISDASGSSTANTAHADCTRQVVLCCGGLQ